MIKKKPFKLHEKVNKFDGHEVMGNFVDVKHVEEFINEVKAKTKKFDNYKKLNKIIDELL